VVTPHRDRSALRSTSTLLFAGFRSFLAYEPSTKHWTELHTESGKYFGTAILDADTLAVVSRPDVGGDQLLLIDRTSAQLVGTKPLPSADTHQIARFRDHLYVTDTQHGRLLRLAVDDLAGPADVVVQVPERAHLNSVLPERDAIRVLLHNYGPSEILTVGPPQTTMSDIGRNSHDLVRWGDNILVCASADGALLQVSNSGAVEVLWSDASLFTKGLTVVENEAWFGCSPPSKRHERWELDCDVIRFDLQTRQVIDRFGVPYPGLLNAIASIGALESVTVGA